MVENRIWFAYPMNRRTRTLLQELRLILFSLSSLDRGSHGPVSRRYASHS